MLNQCNLLCYIMPSYFEFVMLIVLLLASEVITLMLLNMIIYCTLIYKCLSGILNITLCAILHLYTL